ncbi:hypothetical protein H1R20_g7500, partial [Candolleomyces eurysporus]
MNHNEIEKDGRSESHQAGQSRKAGNIIQDLNVTPKARRRTGRGTEEEDQSLTRLNNADSDDSSEESGVGPSNGSSDTRGPDDRVILLRRGANPRPTVNLDEMSHEDLVAEIHGLLGWGLELETQMANLQGTVDTVSRQFNGLTMICQSVAKHDWTIQSIQKKLMEIEGTEKVTTKRLNKMMKQMEQLEGLGIWREGGGDSRDGRTDEVKQQGEQIEALQLQVSALQEHWANGSGKASEAGQHSQVELRTFFKWQEQSLTTLRKEIFGHFSTLLGTVVQGYQSQVALLSHIGTLTADPLDMPLPPLPAGIASLVSIPSSCSETPSVETSASARPTAPVPPPIDPATLADLSVLTALPPLFKKSSMEQ